MIACYFTNHGHWAFFTQTNFFKSKFGVDKESGLSFPDSEKIANAYGLDYISIRNETEIENKLIEFLNNKNSVICEVFCCIQGRSPRLNAIKNDDGTFTNRPFEDMDPFMDREEFKKEMIVHIV